MNINKHVVWAATGIIGAGVAGGLTYAAVATPAAASSDLGSAVDSAISAAATGNEGQAGDMGMRGHMGMRMGAGRHAMLNRIEHGELTLRTRNGDRTVDLQRGTVSAVSPTSISVTSADKFPGTYAVDSATKVRTRSGLVSISSVHVGDQVFVVASAGKAIRILDRAGKSGG